LLIFTLKTVANNELQLLKLMLNVIKCFKYYELNCSYVFRAH
jgi:hypothetical protein